MDYLTTLLLSLVLGILLIYYFFPVKTGLFKEHGIQFLTPLPILGNSAGILMRYETVGSFTIKMYTSFPGARYVGFFDMVNPVLVIRDIDLIKQVTVKNFENFRNHRGFENVDPLFAKNLFALRDEKWRNVRTILSPAFTSSKIKAMYHLMTECAMNFADCMVEMSGAKEMNMKDAFTRYTNDVIATCAFGITINSLKDPKNKFYVYGRDMTTFTNFRALKFFILRDFPMLARLLRLRFVDEHIGNYFKDIIETIIETRKKEGIVRPDMIQLMIESTGKEGAENKLSIDDMVSQAFIFFFAGFDSTATMMSFAALQLAVDPEAQEKLRQEVDAVLENCDGKPTYEAINGMQYLSGVVYEVLRMYPTQVITDRICTKDFELPSAGPGSKPLLVKEGMSVAIPVYGLHHDPKYFPDPWTFKPERFLGNNKEIVNSAYYLPFGIGPRMCIGNRFALLEIKVVLFYLLARCYLKPCSKTVMPIKLKKGMIMEAEGGYWLKIQPRDKPPVIRA